MHSASSEGTSQAPVILRPGPSPSEAPASLHAAQSAPWADPSASVSPLARRGLGTRVCDGPSGLSTEPTCWPAGGCSVDAETWLRPGRCVWPVGHSGLPAAARAAGHRGSPRGQHTWVGARWSLEAQGQGPGWSSGDKPRARGPSGQWWAREPGGWGAAEPTSWLPGHPEEQRPLVRAGHTRRGTGP